MKDLPIRVKEEFRRGNFTVRKRSGKYKGVWTNTVLKQSCNKDAKTKLFSGISQQQAVITKYLKALPELTSISEATMRMVNMMKDEIYHDKKMPEKQKSNIIRIQHVIKE